MLFKVISETNLQVYRNTPWPATVYGESSESIDYNQSFIFRLFASLRALRVLAGGHFGAHSARGSHVLLSPRKVVYRKCSLDSLLISECRCSFSFKAFHTKLNRCFRDNQAHIAKVSQASFKI